jgi:hypothetical protein
MAADWTGTMNALKAVVIFMGVLILIGSTVVVITIINRLGTPAEETAPAAAPAAGSASAPKAFGNRVLDLPTGTQIVSTTAEDGRLFLHVRLVGGGERVLVIDTGTGATLGTLSVPAGQ